MSQKISQSFTVPTLGKIFKISTLRLNSHKTSLSYLNTYRYALGLSKKHVNKRGCCCLLIANMQCKKVPCQDFLPEGRPRPKHRPKVRPTPLFPSSLNSAFCLRQKSILCWLGPKNQCMAQCCCNQKKIGKILEFSLASGFSNSARLR